MAKVAEDREARALEALSEAVRAIAGVLEVESVLQLIVDRVRGLVGARYAALGIVDRNRIERFITSGITPEERARIGPPPEGHGLLGLIITESRSMRVADISAHPASHGFPPHHPPMRTLLGVPVTVKSGTIGNLYLTDKEAGAEFSEEDQHLVELFALHAGIAIENARLHGASQRLAVVEERDRIGRDLHDGIIQSIYAVSLSLEDLHEIAAEEPDVARARIDAAIDALHGTIRDLRTFIFGLRTELVDRTDVAGLVAALVAAVRANAVAEIDVELEALPTEPPPHVRAEIVQIAREALSNVVRHARASRVTVALHAEGEQILLTIADNGRGFDPSAGAAEQHYGLANMRDRAVALGGTFAVETAPASGTRIIVSVPTAGFAGDRTSPGLTQ
ncbi:MAG TPA: GAF domain-containing sensor histidine kinase [Candidatus Limnocylindrales bacterium]